MRISPFCSYLITAAVFRDRRIYEARFLLGLIILCHGCHLADPWTQKSGRSVAAQLVVDLLIVVVAKTFICQFLLLYCIIPSLSFLLFWDA